MNDNNSFWTRVKENVCADLFITGTIPVSIVLIDLAIHIFARTPRLFSFEINIMLLIGGFGLMKIAMMIGGEKFQNYRFYDTYR